MKPDAQKRELPLAAHHSIFQLRFLYSPAHPVHHIGLVSAFVVKEQVPEQAPVLPGLSMHHGQILFNQPLLRHGVRELCGSLPCPGIDHNAAYPRVQPVDAVKAPAQAVAEQLRHSGRL